MDKPTKVYLRRNQRVSTITQERHNRRRISCCLYFLGLRLLSRSTDVITGHLEAMHPAPSKTHISPWRMIYSFTKRDSLSSTTNTTYIPTALPTSQLSHLNKPQYTSTSPTYIHTYTHAVQHIHILPYRHAYHTIPSINPGLDNKSISSTPPSRLTFSLDGGWRER